MRMIRLIFAATVMALIFAADGALAEMRLEQRVPPPVAPVYDAGRKLLPTDALLLDWNDVTRNRKVPVKIYYPTEGNGPFPVIIFSHGLGGSRNGYEYLGRQWAANGYVVVHLQHIGSDDSVWREEGRPMRNARRAASPKNAIDRAKDVKFAIDQRTNLNDSTGPLKGKLDLKHVGVAGHSFGAQTAMLVAGQRMPLGHSSDLADGRVSAAVAMSEPAPAARWKLDEIYSGVRIPVMMMTGTEDNSPIGDTKAIERRIPFDHLHNAPAYLLILNGADHMVFSGRLRTKPTDPPQQKIIRLASTAFWDAQLKRSAAAEGWLDTSGFKQMLGTDGTFEIKQPLASH